MGFTKEPVNQHFVLARLGQGLAESGYWRIHQLLANLLPGNLRLQKVAGIYRIAQKS